LLRERGPREQNSHKNDERYLQRFHPGPLPCDYCKWLSARTQRPCREP
jgi:hypothetical protein